MRSLIDMLWPCVWLISPLVALFADKLVTGDVDDD